MEKLTLLQINSKPQCRLKIGGFPEPGVFRHIREFQTYIEKKEDTTSISFITCEKPLYKFTVYFRNLYEIIQSDTSIYYLSLKSIPALFQEVQVLSTDKWQQEDYHIFNPDPDPVYNLVFPLGLVFRIEFKKYCDPFDMYIDYTRFLVNSSDIINISHEEYPIPEYSRILDLCQSWDLKYMILVLLTNDQMSIADLDEYTIVLLNSCGNGANILEEIYFKYEIFTKTLLAKYIEEGVLSNRVQIVNENHISVRKVRFTPSALKFEPPEIDVSNRVTRKFNFPEFYIRVSIEDENSEKRIWNNCTSILEKFKSLLQCLEVCGRHYEFLGFSNSQMKTHSCWMIAKESGYSADDIRAVLGDFSRCKNNSKYASRLGLCFSGTYLTLQMNRIKIPDIERNSFCFTDGVGRISPVCMANAKARLGVPEDEIVSALQVRIGGCKGVLALYNDCSEIEVRPSMDKFDSTESTLEVCSMSAYRPGYLNRQIILLLSGRGVPNEVFIRLQTNMIKELEESLGNEESALKLLSSNEKDPCVAGIKYMLQNGVKINDEPYLHRMLTALYQVRVSDLKNKARILAPQSLILIGIVDEYALLEYGEVFVYPSKNSDGPITGPIVIAKNPCLHPGDIRVLTAVDKPELHYLKDVVIFPQKGKRPHPNECSGSDLDGDMYFITWNPELIPRISYEEPMDYKAPPEKVESPSILGVLDFFMHYMESENLGNIANTHLALADANGIYDETALKLAELHSMAVDYPKTGVPAIIPPSHRVKKWPDFMEKPEKNTYRSEKILGILYRLIVSRDIKTFIPLIDLRYLQTGYEALIMTALPMYEKYTKELQKFMRQYDTANEFYFLTFQPGDKLGRKGKVDNKLKMQEFVKKIIDDTLEDFHKNSATLEEKKLLASACYFVAYSRDKIGKKIKRKKKLLSFPWIFYEYLI